MIRLRQLILRAPLLLLLGLSGQVLAEACSYREGIMALQQGNQIRGMALLRMASRDGDLRASLYLASLQATDDKQSQRASASLAVLAKSAP